jgi:hypothetical protein
MQPVKNAHVKYHRSIFYAQFLLAMPQVEAKCSKMLHGEALSVQLQGMRQGDQGISRAQGVLTSL